MTLQGPAEVSVSHGQVDKDVLELSYGEFGGEDRRAGGEGGGELCHLRASSYGTEVFKVDLAGGLQAESISIANSTLLVERGMVKATNLQVQGAVQVAGPLSLEETLTIGSGLALTPGGMTVDVDFHQGTLLELRSRQTGFNGSLLELHAEGPEASLIKATVG